MNTVTNPCVPGKLLLTTKVNFWTVDLREGHFLITTHVTTIRNSNINKSEHLFKLKTVYKKDCLSKNVAVQEPARHARDGYGVSSDLGCKVAI
jgi:hypothetical protein